MKKRFSGPQIVAKLRQADVLLGSKVKEGNMRKSIFNKAPIYILLLVAMISGCKRIGMEIQSRSFTALILQSFLSEK